MSDKKYLIDYCKSCSLTFSHSNDMIYVKDASLRICTISDSLIEFIGITDKKLIIGKNIDELSELIDCSKMKDLNTERNRQDKLIINKLNPRNYLEIIPCVNSMYAFIVSKTPIINPVTNNCVGIRCQFSNLFSLHTIKILFRVHNIAGLLMNQKKLPKNNFDEYQLNSMQHMVLYLCIHKFSYSEIAAIMSSIGHKISPNKVNEYIEQLKLIFRSSSKTQLIEKAIGLDFHVFLPKDIVKPCSIDITSYKTIIC